MASIDSLEVLKAIAKQVRNATEVGENTAERVGRFLEGIVNWLKDQNFDERYLRKDIEDTAQQLIHFLNGIDVKGHAVFNDTLSSEDFISGFLSGKGWAIWLKDFINAAGVTEKLACMELDELTIRKTLKVFEFIISQMRGENDNVTFSGFMKVDHYDAETGRIYLKTDDGQLYNPFRVDDYLYCQQFNGMPSGKNDYTVIKTYEFIVTDAQVGSLEDNEKRLDWITLKNFAGDLSLIAENDVLVRLDNLSNPDRKGIIQLMTVGNATPYIDILYGTKTDPDNSLKGRLGNLQGIYHHLFGWLQSFGAYLINLYAVGDFRMRQTGESLDTKIEMTRSLFQTRFQKLSYELTEEDNYLTNATFTENLEGWERENDIDFITMNDEALLLNRSIVTARRKVADIQEYDGQNMLCISNSYIRQLNANIRKPGTHKEYTKVEGGKVSEEFEEVGDTLYLSLKFLCKKSGVLTVGFEGSSVSDDTLPYTTFNVASSVDWQIYKWSGKWDGTGDFVLKFTGDMFVSLLAITDNPLNDYKKEVSTSIEQTHSNIRLLGQNINALEGTVTNLGIDLDAAEEQISIYANKVNTLEGTVTNLGIRLDAAESNITIYANKVDALEGTVTNLGIDLDAAEEQISIYAEKVDANTASISSLKVDVASISSTVTSVQGDLAEAEKVAAAASKAAHDRANEAYNEADSAWWKAYYAQVDADNAQSTADSAYSKAVSNATAVEQNATSISAIAGLFDEDGHLLEGSGWVTTTSYNSLYSIVTDLNGKVAAKAELSTSVQYDPSTGYVTSAIKLTADKISIEGITTINNSFSVDTDGTTRIAGFTVSGNGLINSGFNNDAYVIFRNDTHKTFAGIGGNVLPSSTGLRAVARFENHDEEDFWYMGANYAMLVSAQGGRENVAIQFNGGSLSCLAIKTQIIGHDNVVQSTAPTTKYVTLDRNVASVYVSTQFNWKASSSETSYTSKTRNVYLTLPTMDVYDDGHVIKIKRGSNDGSWVYVSPGGSYRMVYNSSTGKYVRTYGTSYIMYDNASYGTTSSKLGIESQGDAMEFVYHRDLQITINNVTYYGCWIQYKHPRSW